MGGQFVVIKEAKVQRLWVTVGNLLSATTDGLEKSEAHP